MLRICLYTFLFLFTFNVSGITPASAQTLVDLTRALTRLDRDLARAQELVTSFNNDRAIRLVQQAQQLRDEAANLIHKDRPTRRDRTEAAAKIKLAQARLMAAAQLALDGPVRRLRSRLEELLRKADETVPHSRNREAQRTLNEAKKNRDSGERAATAASADKAAEHFRVGITLAERAIQLSARSVDTIIDHLREEKRKFEVLRDHTRQLIDQHGNRQAELIFQQALRTYESAETTFRNGNVDLTKTLLNQASLLLLRATDLARSDSPGHTDQPSSVLFRVHELLQETRDRVRASQSPAAKRILERASRFVMDAEAAAKAGNTQLVMTKLELAENMIRRANRLAAAQSRRPFNKKVLREIENTRSDIAAVRQNMHADTPRDAGTLLRMSEFALQRAEQASAAGFSRVALEAVLAAQRFLSRAEQVTSDDGAGRQTRAQTEVRLKQLETALVDAESRVVESMENWSLQLLQSARAIKRLAEDSFRKGDYRAANEGIQVSFELLRKSLKYVPKN